MNFFINIKKMYNFSQQVTCFLSNCKLKKDFKMHFRPKAVNLTIFKNETKL